MAQLGAGWLLLMLTLAPAWVTAQGSAGGTVTLEVHTGAQLVQALQNNSVGRISLMADIAVVSSNWPLLAVERESDVIIGSGLPGNSANGDQIRPVLDLQWANERVHLLPGVTLIFQNLTIEGSRTTVAIDFYMFTFSPGAIVHVQDTGVRYAACLPKDLLVYSFSRIPRAAGVPNASTPIGPDGVQLPQAVYTLDSKMCFVSMEGVQDCSAKVMKGDLWSDSARLDLGLQGFGLGGYASRYERSPVMCDAQIPDACLQTLGLSKCFENAAADSARRAETIVSGESSSRLLKIVLPTTLIGVAVVLCLFSTFLWVCLRTNRQAVWLRRHRAPKAGELTCLVVTDIESSTQAWETADATVMEAAMLVHDAVMHAAMVTHCGTESHGEGDSAIIAFHCSADAVGFACQLQHDLMVADWPVEMLTLPSACPVFVDPPQDAPLFPGSDDGRTGVRRLASGQSTDQLAARSMSSLQLPTHEPTPKPTLCSWLGSLLTCRFSPRSSTPPAEYPMCALQLGPPMSGPINHSLCHNSRQFSGNALPVSATLPVRGSARRTNSGLAQGISLGTQLQTLWTVATGHDDLFREDTSGSVSTKSAVCIMRGFRVRVGIMCGLQAADIELNTTTHRVHFGGQTLALGKAVCDAAQGGMVLMTGEVFHSLAVSDGVVARGLLSGNFGPAHMSRSGGVDNMLLHMGDFAPPVGLACSLGQQSIPNQESIPLYQAVNASLAGRLALLGPVRGLTKVLSGTLDAPVGSVCVVFMHFVGHATLLAWHVEIATHAITVWSGLVTSSLAAHRGYLVELGEGLCLAAFMCAPDAIAFALSVKDAMFSQEWPIELLQHELCEEVVLEGAGKLRSKSGNLVAQQSVVLMRGPRIRVGIDCSADVRPALSATTGRVVYRGRLMNRAARLASCAPTGGVLCTADAWQQVEHLRSSTGLPLSAMDPEGIMPSPTAWDNLAARCMGPAQLKGVGTLTIWSCVWIKRSVCGSMRLQSTPMLDVSIARGSAFRVSRAHVRASMDDLSVQRSQVSRSNPSLVSVSRHTSTLLPVLSRATLTELHKEVDSGLETDLDLEWRLPVAVQLQQHAILDTLTPLE